jgi:hypothetical protein
MRASVLKTYFVLTAVLSACLALASAPAAAKDMHKFETSFNGGAAPGGPFSFLLTVAADRSGGASNGDVYVSQLNSSFESSVYKFSANGAYAGPQLTGANTPATSFSLLSFSTYAQSGMAVDNSAGANKGDLYVADIGHEVVDRFSEAGVFQCQITAKAPVSAEEIAHECNGAAGSKTPDGSFTPSGVAVDGVGDVYVADEKHHVIDKFGPTGSYVTQIVDSHLTFPGELAIDAAGNLYVANATWVGGSDIVKFNAAGAFVSVLDANGTFSVAVDPASGHVYVADSEPAPQIAEYDAAGKLLDVFGAGQIGQQTVGLTVGPSGKVYAADASNQVVEIFSPDIVIPDASTGQATNIQETTATLHGHVDPDTTEGGGEVTECGFEYVTDKQFTEHAANPYEGAVTAPCEPHTPYNAPTDVGAGVTGLSPSTTYHFRVVADSAAGIANGFVSYGQDQTLSTVGPPAVDSESSSQVRASTAVLSAQINPFGYDTSCQVQYVADASFQSSGYAGATTLPCTPSDLGSAFGDRGASATPSGLAIGTTYHFRFIATNQAGKATGADQTFATFGVESFKVETLDREGHPYTQAAGHPYALTSVIDLSTTTSGLGNLSPDQNVKDIRTELPPGLIGNPTAAKRCTRAVVPIFQCPADSQVGLINVQTSDAHFEEPVYNLVPPAGDAAEFGARFSNSVTGYIDFHVRTGGDYGVNADALNLSANSGIVRISLTVWGVPADPSHDPDRFCSGFDSEGHPLRGCSAGAALVPFLTNPTSCAGPQTATLRVDSWQNPGEFASATSTMPAFTGCDRPDFTPAITLQPDTSVADSPSGLNIKLSVPQNENPYGLAEANLKTAAVALPAGVSVSPSAANGLTACSPEQIGIENASEPACPDASKIGSVEVNTPLLPNPLKGAVYVAQQNNNPFGSLLAIYVTAEDPVSGALVKLAGHVVADPLTGQLTTTFDNNPQLPFSDFKLEFFGGPRGALATPESCGTFTADSALTPWSGTSTVGLSEPFTFAAGCVSGFAPVFTAGVTNPQAGAYSPFVLSFSRSDTDQEISGLSVSLPPGLLAKIAGVPLCSDANANAGTCPEASQVGTVQAAAGPGSQPFFLSGKAYLTGPYNGGPYGLSVVVPAVAGPFNFGNVVVRQSLRIDPHDAHVTDVSNPFPTILDPEGANHEVNGIPIRLRRVDVSIDRPDFTFNPTNCNPMAIAATPTSTAGLSAPVSSRFQAANCATLKFAPKFTVSTSGKTSKANGASLTTKLAYPNAPQGTQADIAYVKVELPKQLPSRLTTLQKACLARVFEADPAGCPAASIIGHATVTTPLLPLPLSGPAYFVSHGGEAFPSLTIILQGNGVTLDLVGTTFINKAGVTSTTFKTVPDTPFNAFELTLPQGKFSALAANGNLCTSKLAMPTEFVAQNGAVIHQSTPISVTGCAKKKTLTRAQKLAAAMKACHKDKNHSKRSKCETTAKKRYGRKTKAKK